MDYPGDKKSTDGGDAVLSYASQPTVANFVADRRDNGVVITVLPDARRILRAVGIFSIILIVALGYGAILFHTNSPQHRQLLAVIIVPSIILALGLYQLGSQLIWILTPAKWEVDDQFLSYTCRRLLAVQKQNWRRQSIADLRVERLRVKDRLRKRAYMAMQMKAGQLIPLASDSRTGLEYLCVTLREALGLPPDPTGMGEYPPPPRRCRMTRTLLPRGVMLGVPAARPFIASIVTAAAVFFASLRVDDFLFGGGHNGWIPSTNALWPLARAAIFGLLGFILIWSLLIKLRRSIVIAINLGQFFYIESGLLRPCHVELPVEEVNGINLLKSVGKERASVEVVVTHGDPIMICPRIRRDEIEWLVASLQIALGRARRKEVRGGTNGNSESGIMK